MQSVRCLVIGWLRAGMMAGRAGAQEFVPPPDDDALFGAAFALAEAGQWERARGLAAGGGQPALVKVVTWVRLSRAQPLPPFEEIAGFIEANPDWPGGDTLRRRAEVAMGDTTAPGRGIAGFATNGRAHV